MEKLLRNTAELVRHTTKMEVELDIQGTDPQGLPLTAQADANQLQQVLVNLALNARDAQTAPKPLVFRLRHQILSEELAAFPENISPGDYVVLEVQDYGQGMSPEILSQALDPFFTTKGVGQGTGLGLSVAFGIIQGHQGFLAINTQEGQGTCICLYLPRLVTSHRGSGEQSTETGKVQETEKTPSYHILVVDDEDAVLDVVRRFLEIAGHTVTCASNVRQALELLDDGRPAVDMAILDWMIPREDGVTNFHLLRQRIPGLPVLLCTGLLQAEPAQELLSQGAVGLLRKPFQMKELWNTVSKALTTVHGQ
jgi:CheY-like chemotaxis protein